MLKLNSKILLTIGLIFISNICMSGQNSRYDKQMDKLVADLVTGVKDKSIKKIAVANFCETSSKQRFALSDILEEDLTINLIQAKKYDVIIKSRTDEILKELKFGNEGFVDPFKVKQFGKFSQADAILMGTYREKNNYILINAQLINVETMEAIWGDDIAVPRKEFPESVFQFPNVYQEKHKVQPGEKEKAKAHKPTGSISVISDPSGAEINLDAVDMGRTPAIIQSVSSGERKITLIEKGYEDYIADIKVGPGEMYTEKATLTQETGKLKLDTVPSVAEIYIDGYKKGNSPLDISLVTGTYEIKAKKEGFQDYKETVKVAYKEVEERKFQLIEDPGSLLIKVQPFPATVYIDDIEEKEKADPKLSFKTFPSGEHIVRIVKDGYEDYEQAFVIHANKSETISAVLKKGTGELKEKSGSNLIAGATREGTFNKLYEKAKKMEWGDMQVGEKGKLGFWDVYEKLVKQVKAGKDVFEKNKDESGAEKEYKETIESIYYIPIIVEVKDYDLTSQTFHFEKIYNELFVVNRSQTSSSGYGAFGILSFGKEISFGPLMLGEKDAQEIKDLTLGFRKPGAEGCQGVKYDGPPTEEYFVRGVILFKVKEGVARGQYPHASCFINAELIDARIEVPKIGFIYLNHNTRNPEVKLYKKNLETGMIAPV